MNPFNYYKDRFGKKCLELAKLSKGEMAFGAVFVKQNRILGIGWNRLSTSKERETLRHIDYAIHAEQACVIDALEKGFNVNNGRVYVLGFSNNIKTRGQLSTRDGKYFTCRKCPHALIKYNLSVYIPHITDGWLKLTGEEALTSAKEHLGYWKTFTSGGNPCLVTCGRKTG